MLPGSPTAISAPSATFASVTDVELQQQLQARFDGDTFQPWSGWIAFDETQDWFFDPSERDSIPLGPADFYSVALHEIGHVLGVGTATSFKRLIGADGKFAGVNAVAANGGAAVPLTSDGTHMLNSVRFEGRRVLMDLSDSPGERTVPTGLDEAILADLGYHFAP